MTKMSEERVAQAETELKKKVFWMDFDLIAFLKTYSFLFLW